MVVSCCSFCQFRSRYQIRPTPHGPLFRCADWSEELSVVAAVSAAEPDSTRRTVDGLDCVILEERLKEHAQRAEHAHEHKDPEEEAVDHHGDVLPVLAHLQEDPGGGRSR